MSTTNARKPLYKSLYAQVLFAVTVGVLLGHFYPDWVKWTPESGQT